MKKLWAVTGAEIFDSDSWHRGKVLLLEGERVVGIVEESELPAGVETYDSAGSLLVPGFIDLQVNGGGGVLLNDDPDVVTIRRICTAHAAFGTTGLMPTLITDTPDKTGRAIAAAIEAHGQNVPGFIGLHLEGPHLAPDRVGAHDRSLVRPMNDGDLAQLIEARRQLPSLLVTIAPENVTTRQIKAMSDAGITVSLGHTDAGYEAVCKCVEAGASMVTHLYNAMSPLGHREPGMVGAALQLGELYAGLIGDGIHVDPVSIEIASRAKKGPGKILLVTDAMATIGTDLQEFHLNGREIRRSQGRLTLADGTLAGADIDMISSVRFINRTVGLHLDETLRMASLYPAEVIHRSDTHGVLASGCRADFIELSADLEVRSTWIGGNRVTENS